MTQVNDNYPKKGNNELSDEQLKELAIQNMQRQEVRTNNFPTEIISLPSQGKVYAEGNPLAAGTIEMKYMTAREEDILTSANLIRQGIVLDKLMQSMIVSPINFNDLVIGDKNAIMIAARILGYGKQYEIDVTCPACTKKTPVDVDLTQLPDKHVLESAKMLAPNLFEFTLPQSQRIITFKILTQGDDKQIQTELNTQKKASNKDSVDRELSTRLKHIIQSVDSETSKQYINHFVDNELFAMDSRALRTYIKEVTPDQKFEISFNCSECGHDEEALAFAVDTTFFWPKS